MAREAADANRNPTSYWADESEGNGWAEGFSALALLLLFLSGFALLIVGFSAVIDNAFIKPAAGYALDTSAKVWGWSHLLAGVISLATAAFLMMSKSWARYMTIAISALVVAFSFVTLPGYPVMSLFVIGMNVGIIWALSLHWEG